MKVYQGNVLSVNSKDEVFRFLVEDKGKILFVISPDNAHAVVFVEQRAYAVSEVGGISVEILSIEHTLFIAVFNHTFTPESLQIIASLSQAAKICNRKIKLRCRAQALGV